MRRRRLNNRQFSLSFLLQNYMLFGEHWHQWARLDNLIQVLGCHAEFLESFLTVHILLFFGDLSIPYTERYYIALLVS